MKAILTYTVTKDDKSIDETRLFNTETATKICDINNAFKNKVQEIYITKSGILFILNVIEKKLEIANQKECKAWIGKNEPDKYIKFFGEVEEG